MLFFGSRVSPPFFTSSTSRSLAELQHRARAVGTLRGHDDVLLDGKNGEICQICHESGGVRTEKKRVLQIGTQQLNDLNKLGDFVFI